MAGLYIETISYSDADPLVTQSAIITSIPVVELVAKEAGIIDREISSKDVLSTPELLNIVLDLKGKISTSVEESTNIINISAVTTDSAFSAELANATAKVFQLSNIEEKNRRTIEAKKFIEGRLKQVGKRLKISQEKLKALRQEKRFVTMELLARETVRRLEEAESSHKEVVRKIKDIDGLIVHLEAQKSMPTEKTRGFYAQTISTIFATLNDKLGELQSKKSILMLDFTEMHPDVKRVNREIDNTTANMLEHLRAEKAKLSEIEKITTEEMKKQEYEYRALPEITFDLTEIESEIETDQLLYKELKSRHQDVLIKEAEKIQEVAIVRPALESRKPVNPSTTVTTTAIGTIIGLILGVVVAFVRETIDTSIGTIEEVEEFLGVPVLGVIPYMDVEEIKDRLLKTGNTDQPEEILEMNARLVSHFAPKSTMAESYRAMRTGIEFIISDKKIKTLSVTSSSTGEGKTTVTCNFAMSLAQIGKKVLLIDGDLRKPMVNRVYGIEREPGLADVILGNYDWNEVIKTDTDIMMGEMGMEDITTAAPGINNLNIITAGLIPPNSAELLNSVKMSDILSQMKDEYDIVLYDSPPVLPSTDAVILAQKVEGVIMVYKVGQIARGALKRAKSQMDNTKANVIGVVLNCLRPETGGDYKDYGYYGYYYAYGEDMGSIPWYRRWFPGFFTMPKMVQRLIGSLKGEKDTDRDLEKSDSHGKDATIQPWYKRYLNIQRLLTRCLERIKKVQREKQLFTIKEEESPEELSWKIRLRMIVLIIASIFILFGLLWQSGIIKRFL